MMKQLILILILIIVAVGAAFLIRNNQPVENPKADLIRVDTLEYGAAVQSPLEIKGAARGYWFFEASFPVKIFDDNNFLLGIKPAQALSEWMTEDFVPYETTISFAVPSTPRGKVVLKKDNPSGLPEHDDELVIPVTFKDMPEAPKKLMASKIFLNDSNYVNEPYFDCSKTIVVQRQVPETSGVARAAIEALLRGATQEEINQGYISSINPGVRIQSLTIAGGVARIDFDEQLEFQVGGSCRVTAIRAQIIDTLKQFTSVENVIISIDGRTEDILQP